MTISKAYSMDISIRSPHARGDDQHDDQLNASLEFQSTPLTRGETRLPRRTGCGSSYFNPLPSREGRHLGIDIDKAVREFQSTPLTRGETRACQRPAPAERISIHSPHTRGDQCERPSGVHRDISIHSPHTRGDRGADPARADRAHISIRSPLTRGDSISLQKSIRIYVSLHNKTMIHRFLGLYKPLFCGAEPDIRGAKPTGKP